MGEKEKRAAKIRSMLAPAMTLAAREYACPCSLPNPRKHLNNLAFMTVPVKPAAEEARNFNGLKINSSKIA